jgi:hypothetical protein
MAAEKHYVKFTKSQIFAVLMITGRKPKILLSNNRTVKTVFYGSEASCIVRVI